MGISIKSLAIPPIFRAVQSELKAKTAQDQLGSRSREFSFIKFS
jgi:hypothetical protein